LKILDFRLKIAACRFTKLFNVGQQIVNLPVNNLKSKIKNDQAHIFDASNLINRRNATLVHFANGG
jgi:hypothetical protein